MCETNETDILTYNNVEVLNLIRCREGKFVV